MTPMAYEFVASGAADEHTLRWNREAFDRIRLRPSVLREVATVDTRVTLLGRDLAFPILLSPTAYHRVLHPDEELDTARGAGAADDGRSSAHATDRPARRSDLILVEVRVPSER